MDLRTRAMMNRGFIVGTFELKRVKVYRKETCRLVLAWLRKYDS